MTDSGEKNRKVSSSSSDSDNIPKKKLIWNNFTRELLSASVVFENIMPECVTHWLCLLCSRICKVTHKWPVVYSTNLQNEKLVLWLFSAVSVECREAVSKDYHNMTFTNLSEIEVLRSFIKPSLKDQSDQKWQFNRPGDSYSEVMYKLNIADNVIPTFF